MRIPIGKKNNFTNNLYEVEKILDRNSLRVEKRVEVNPIFADLVDKLLGTNTFNTMNKKQEEFLYGTGNSVGFLKWLDLSLRQVDFINGENIEENNNENIDEPLADTSEELQLAYRDLADKIFSYIVTAYENKLPMNIESIHNDLDKVIRTLDDIDRNEDVYK